MAIKIVVINKKGGVAKTTTASNVSAFLAEMGKKVLAIDGDSQGNLSHSFGIDIHSPGNSIVSLFENKCTIDEAIINVFPNLDIIRGSENLEKIFHEEPLSVHKRKNDLLKFRLGETDKKYDFIFIDTTSGFVPSTYNCMSIADYVLIPMQFESFSVKGLRQMIDEICAVRDKLFLNNRLKVLGVLGTFYRNTKNNKRHKEEVEANSGENKVYLFQSVVRRCDALSVATDKGLPINRFQRKGNGYADYEALTLEILGRLRAIGCM